METCGDSRRYTRPVGEENEWKEDMMRMIQKKRRDQCQCVGDDVKDAVVDQIRT